MGAYTSSQLITRLLALALGMAGGLCQTVWSQVVSMRCGATAVGEYVFHLECLPWTQLFLRFPQDVATQWWPGAGLRHRWVYCRLWQLWRPRWAALLFALLAVVNLGLVIYAAATGDQKGIAVTLPLS